VIRDEKNIFLISFGIIVGINIIMKRIIYVSLLVFSVFSFQSCMKLEDTFFAFRVLDSTNDEAIRNMDVTVKKLKPGWGLFAGREVIETYAGKTDEKGEVIFFVEDYNRDDFSYDIIVNNFSEVPDDYGGYGYGKYGTVVDYQELTEVFTVKLGRIIFPDSK
jgi:hypothetical protein